MSFKLKFNQMKIRDLLFRKHPNDGTGSFGCCWQVWPHGRQWGEWLKQRRVKTQKKKRKMIVDQDRIRAAAMRGVPPPPMGLFLQICSHSDDILVQACARCKCSAISIVKCIFGALFLGLGCNIFLVLRLWCYALSAVSRRLATAVALLLYLDVCLFK